MGKVFNSMVMGIIITVALALFQGSGIASTSLVLMLLNPSGWADSSFWAIFSALTLTGAGVIVIGLAAIIRQDWVVRAGMVLTLSSIVVAPFVDLFTFMTSHLGYIATTCVNAPICTSLNSIGGIGQFMAILIAGPLLLYSLWACIEWIFKGDSF